MLLPSITDSELGDNLVGQLAPVIALGESASGVVTEDDEEEALDWEEANPDSPVKISLHREAQHEGKASAGRSRLGGEGV